MHIFKAKRVSSDGSGIQNWIFGYPKKIRQKWILIPVVEKTHPLAKKKHFHHQDRNRAPDFSLSIRHYSVTVSPTPKCNSVFCQDKSQKEVTQKGFDKIKDFSS